MARKKTVKGNLKAGAAKPPKELNTKGKKLEEDEKSLGMLSHLLAIFTGFIAPLIILLVKMDNKGFAYHNARHSLNFQISIIIYSIVAALLMLVLIGFVLLAALGIFALVVMIIATIRSAKGDVYKYPLEIPFIS